MALCGISAHGCAAVMPIAVHLLVSTHTLLLWRARLPFMCRLLDLSPLWPHDDSFQEGGPQKLAGESAHM